jgi:hypothetical protein
MNNEELAEIRSLIEKARNFEMRKNELITDIYFLLEDYEPENIPSGAENASNLEEAISCFIQYGEYGLESIMKEISELLGGTV